MVSKVCPVVVLILGTTNGAVQVICCNLFLSLLSAMPRDLVTFTVLGRGTSLMKRLH